MINRREVLKAIAVSAVSGLSIPKMWFTEWQGKIMQGKETRIFDPADGFGPLTDPTIITDCTIVKRDNRWWMYMGGRVKDKPGIYLFSATLPEGAPLAAT